MFSHKIYQKDISSQCLVKYKTNWALVAYYSVRKLEAKYNEPLRWQTEAINWMLKREKKKTEKIANYSNK